MLTQVVITGAWPSPDGVRAGEVILSLSGDMRDADGGAVVPAGQQVARLDEDGRIAVQVYAVDDDGILPSGRVYWVEERIVGATPRWYDLVVPAAPAGSRAVHDAVTSAAHLTSASAAFTGGDVGAWVTGEGLAPLTTIAAVLGPTAVTLSAPVLEGGSGLDVVIGASLDLAAV